MNARVEPGDSILVPEKLVQVRFMKDAKDITQILYRIAVTAGVLIVPIATCALMAGSNTEAAL
jgi:hypothetical protein